MNNRIAVNPKIHFGKPCVAGTRIPVQSVLELVREGAADIHQPVPFGVIFMRKHVPATATSGEAGDGAATTQSQ